ncbi:hypothetical protein KR044_003190 [Drosophila immigrans]|nr:hypothetical protein KR044_003190 [Drosophila immigrans]
MAPSNARALESRRSRGTQSFRCRVCRGIHPLKRCSRFLRLSAEKRLRAVLVNKYCANCLAHQHSGQSCASGDRCRVCQQAHHTLLHMHEPVRRRSATKRRHRAPARAPSASSDASAQDVHPTPLRQSAASPSGISDPLALAALLQNRSTNLLPTATVQIRGTEKSFQTRALIDPGAPLSAIDASFAAAMQVPSITVGEGRVGCVSVGPVSGTGPWFEVLLQIKDELRLSTPIRAVDSSVREHYADIDLADGSFDRPSAISLVLGADAYAHIIKEGIITNQRGLPVAQRTIFGWTLSGSCAL